MSETRTTDMTPVYEDVLADFANTPEDQAVWDTAYELVRQEALEPIGDGTVASGIGAEDLIAFAEQVRATPQAERYNLTANIAPDGQPWFDVLEGFSSKQLNRALADVVHSLYGPGYRYQRALDVGVGSGNSLNILEGAADSVVGMDRNQHVLHLAERKKAPTTELIQGNATALPFADESFDLILGAGVEAALDKPGMTAFATELGRVLMPYGVYIAGSYGANQEGYEGSELAQYTASAKAMLVDMIGDTTCGALARDSYLTNDELYDICQELSMDFTVYEMPDSATDDGTVSHVRVIQKIPAN